MRGKAGTIASDSWDGLVAGEFVEEEGRLEVGWSRGL